MESAIKTKALELGFARCGIAQAGPVDAATRAIYERWIAENRHGEMGYLARNIDKRLDPTKLVPGCKSLVVCAMNYRPSETIPQAEWQVAYYAYGKDYHRVMKERLWALLAWMNAQREERGERPKAESQRAFVDSAPLLERYWAARAGLGWIGRNQLLIIPRMGSWFFLGIIATDLALKPDEPEPSRCGNCRRCLDACPTKALTLNPDGATTTMDARRCISYLTIEQKSPISSEFFPQLGGRIYGCDECQKCCPWNRFSRPTSEPDFRPSATLLGMKKEAWQALTRDEYARLFKGSAVERAGYEGLQRNIETAAEAEEER